MDWCRESSGDPDLGSWNGTTGNRRTWKILKRVLLFTESIVIYREYCYIQRVFLYTESFVIYREYCYIQRVLLYIESIVIYKWYCYVQTHTKYLLCIRQFLISNWSYIYKENTRADCRFYSEREYNKFGEIYIKKKYYYCCRQVQQTSHHLRQWFSIGGACIIVGTQKFVWW
jgi:hypothetical protein